MPYSPLLIQLVVILVFARGLGLILRYFGQSPVIGEMVAGFMLGPVVFGSLAPELHGKIFDPASLPALDGLAQLGLVLFMFIVGAELRLPLGVRPHLIAASWVGVLSMLVPMLLGLAIAVPLYPDLAPEGVAPWPFALFMACTISITAFPVLARILKDRRMTHTTIGRLALTGAAVADVMTWVLLALVVVVIRSGSDWTRLMHLLIGISLLAVFLFAGLQPLFGRFLKRYVRDGDPAGPMLAMLLIGALGSAFATEALGVHAVFGAFLFGACLPRDDRLLHALIERIEHIAVIVLMPVFFALVGLKTTPDAFVGASFGAMMVILATAVAGKIAGGSIGARLAGQPWRTALAVGSLMNARGLMELIVMKVGLDIGVIGPSLFTMLMVMAIVTTFLTGPALTLFAPREKPEPHV